MHMNERYISEKAIYTYSTGVNVINLERMNVTKNVPATKQATKIYHVSSSKTSVNAGT